MLEHKNNLVRRYLVRHKVRIYYLNQVLIAGHRGIIYEDSTFLIWNHNNILQQYYNASIAHLLSLTAAE